MNKRLIKKLENATDTWCQKNYIPYPDKHYHNEWNEKFAELIVWECFLIGAKYIQSNDDVSKFEKHLKKHFGVEK